MKHLADKYIEVGTRAGDAMNSGDTGKASLENSAFRTMQSEEKGHDIARSQALFQNAYRDTRNNE